MSTWLEWVFSLVEDCVDACAYRNDHSYLSMIAHMSRLTFSKAPTVPFSTACKSAGWSSTRIACMQPWRECREGGNSVWRKYPETKVRHKPENKRQRYYTWTHHTLWKRPSVEVEITLNNSFIFDEEQPTSLALGYCHYLQPQTFISPLVLELIHMAH